jgi:HTH-type transcriptional regulator/antitoxin HipB
MRVNSIRNVAVAIRGRRKDLGLNQAELARRVGVSRKWIYEFEAGKPTAEFGIVMRVLDELGLSFDIAKDSGEVGGKPLAVSRAVDLDALLDEHRER